ncbi:MAG: glycosyltransferase [Bacteroidales bacterium]|nr:glycosyltransferase [Bacteroidales bacterium]
MNSKTTPLVSIVTVTLNLIKAGREKSFRQCLESVRNQTYENIEHIIIDGASSDGTIDILNNYANRKWIKYISEVDTGIYDSMNKGLKLANGKYIAFLNSDDYFHGLDGVDASVKALENSKAVFSYAPVINLDESQQAQNIIYPKMKNVFLTIMPNHQTMFFKRSVLINEGLFNTNYKCVGDYDMTIRLCLKNHKSIFVDNIFSTYRLGGFSKIATDEGLVFEEVSNIYYENYNRLISITREECEKICGNIYDSDYSNIPPKLARKLKHLLPYFDYVEFLEKNRLTKVNKPIFISSFWNFFYKNKIIKSK